MCNIQRENILKRPIGRLIAEDGITLMLKFTKIDQSVFFLFFFFTLSFIFTSFREQDEAYINSLRWSALVGLKPAYTRM